jgi:(R,R)-butanediol dehydrogenase / meso-butanediol dehydrogenase / diacetyl reductase
MRVTVIKQGELVTEERPRPVPGPGQVLVRNLACGICGSDLHILNTVRGMGEAAPEVILGHEFCSEIVAFGPETQQQLTIGQRVCSIPFIPTEEGQDLIGASPTAPGAYSEYMLLSEPLLLAVPDSTSTEAAALVEPLAVAIHAVAKANLNGSDSALVMGCGPIGLAIVAVLKMRGVETVIASDYSPKRRALATAMGADTVVDPAEQSAFDLLGCAVGKVTDNAVIFECVGAKPLLAQICGEAPERARIVMAGICAEDVSFNPFVAMQKELNIQFVYYYQPEEYSEALRILADDEINWRPFITGKVGLDGINSAFTTLRDPETHAKILIDPWHSGDAIEPVKL